MYRSNVLRTQKFKGICDVKFSRLIAQKPHIVHIGSVLSWFLQNFGILIEKETIIFVYIMALASN